MDARKTLPASLSVLAVACGARSSLGVGAGDSSAAEASFDAAAEESREPQPAFWTFTTPGSAWALALDDDGNPFVAVHDSPWSPRKTTVYKLDGLTKNVIWKTTLTKAPVYSMAYAGGALYLTGVTYPATHLDFGNLTLDLPAIGSDSASYIAKLDAGDGRAIWAISPDVGRAPNAMAASKCLHIAADSNGAAVLCGYQGADFGVEKPYLTDRGSVAVLRVASTGASLWARAFSGDPVVGHVWTFRRPITLDANGDIWFAGMTSLPLVDESSSTSLIPGSGNASAPRAYVVRVESGSQIAAPASSWPLATGTTEREPDVASIATADSDVFLAGTLGTAQGYAMCLDAQTLATRWQSLFLADSVRATADGSGGLFVALASAREHADLARFDRNGALLRSIVVRVSCGPCLPFVSASDVELDARHRALYFLGVATGRVRFDDGMEVDSPSANVVFLARRPAF